MGPNMGQQLNKQVKVDLQANHKQMKPKQANHQLKLNLQTIMQVKANHKQMKPKQANHQQQLHMRTNMQTNTNMRTQVNMQHNHKQMQMKVKSKHKQVKLTNHKLVLNLGQVKANHKHPSQFIERSTKCSFTFTIAQIIQLFLNRC